MAANIDNRIEGNQLVISLWKDRGSLCFGRCQNRNDICRRYFAIAYDRSDQLVDH